MRSDVLEEERHTLYGKVILFAPRNADFTRRVLKNTTVLKVQNNSKIIFTYDRLYYTVKTVTREPSDFRTHTYVYKSSSFVWQTRSGRPWIGRDFSIRK